MEKPHRIEVEEFPCKKLGYKSQFDVNETAWDCWLKIKAVKT